MANLSFKLDVDDNAYVVFYHVIVRSHSDGGYEVFYRHSDHETCRKEYAYTIEAALDVAAAMEYSKRIYDQQVEYNERTSRRAPRSYGRKAPIAATAAASAASFELTF